MTTPIANVDNTTLNNVTVNLDIDDVADPALRKAAFQYIYTEMQTIITAFNAFVAAGGIASGNLADLSVTTAKLADLAVTTGKIPDLAIVTAKINDLAVTAGKIALGTITSAQIADLGIATGDLADAIITTIKLADLNVTTGKLADACVTLLKMADASVGTSQLVDLSVTNGKVANATLTADKFVAGALNNDTQNGLRITALSADILQRGINVKHPPSPLVAAKGDGVTDDAPAINAIIDYAVTNHIYLIVVPSASYNIVSEPVNLTSITGNNKAGIKLVGVRSTQYKNGSLFIGNTGAGNSVIETVDTDGLYLQGIGVVAGTSTPSTIGILQARGVQLGWGGDQYYENVFIDMGSDTAANNGVGRIGIVNLASEEAKYHNPQIWANLPMVITWSSTFLCTNDTYTGQTTVTLSSFFGNTLAVDASNTVFRFSGLGRLIAVDYSAPCILLFATASVDLGSTFLQKRTGTSTLKNHQYAIEQWNVFQFSHKGSLEGCEGYLLNRRTMTDADLNVHMESSAYTLPIIYFYDDGGDYLFDNNNIKIYNSQSDRILMDGKRADSSDSEPLRFDLHNLTLNTNLSLNRTSLPDARLFRKIYNSVLKGGDDLALSIGNKSMKIEIEKNIGAPSTATDVLEIVMPTYITNHGAFGVSIEIHGMLTNATLGVVGLPSTNQFKSMLNISNGHNGINIVASTPSTTIASQADVNGAGNSITGVTLVATVDNTGNTVTISAEGAASGTNLADILLKASVEIFWSGAYRDTLFFVRL